MARVAVSNVIFPQRFQYDSLVEPITPPGQEVERISVDKWFVPPPDYIWDRKRLQYMYPSLSWHSKILVSPSTISGIYVNVIFSQKTQYQQWAKPIAPPGQESELTTLDKWYRELSLPQKLKGPQQQWSYPSFFFYSRPILSQAAISGSYVNVIFSQRFQYQALTDSLFNRIPFFVELDKWYVRANEPRWDKQRNQYLYPFFATDPQSMTQAERVDLDKWYKELSHTIWGKEHREYLYPSLAIDPFLLTQHEQINLDKWYQELQRPPKGAKHWEHLYPYFSTDPISLTVTERIDLDKWFKELERPPKGPKHWEYLYPSFSIDADALTRHERIDLDKWFQELQRPPKGYKHWEFLYPPLSIDPQAMTLGESINMDKWFRELGRPPFRYKATPHIYPYFFWYPKIILSQTSIEGPRVHIIFPQQFQYQRYFAVYEPNLILQHIWTITPEGTLTTYTKETKPTASYTMTAKPSATYSKETKPTATFTKETKPTATWVITDRPKETVNTF